MSASEQACSGLASGRPLQEHAGVQPSLARQMQGPRTQASPDHDRVRRGLTFTRWIMTVHAATSHMASHSAAAAYGSQGSQLAEVTLPAGLTGGHGQAAAARSELPSGG